MSCLGALGLAYNLRSCLAENAASASEAFLALDLPGRSFLAENGTFASR